MGDSILDNSYWNDVGTNTTAEILKKHMKVIDRATEEATTARLIDALDSDVGISVRAEYVANRNRLGIPYDGQFRGDQVVVYPIPNSDSMWWKLEEKNRYVVVSIGGNDLALSHTFELNTIMTSVEKCLNMIVEKLKIERSHLTYLIPYPPTETMCDILKDQNLTISGSRVTPKEFYTQMTKRANEVCSTLKVSVISLEDFGPADRAGRYIPEPTPKGAAEIAKRIKERITVASPSN